MKAIEVTESSEINSWARYQHVNLGFTVLILFYVKFWRENMQQRVLVCTLSNVSLSNAFEYTTSYTLCNAAKIVWTTTLFLEKRYSKKLLNYETNVSLTVITKNSEWLLSKEFYGQICLTYDQLECFASAPNRYCMWHHFF